MVTEERIIESVILSEVIERGAPIRKALNRLQDHWGVPRVALIKAKDADDRGLPGAHGIPEIGRQERAFYDALTRPQQQAYLGVKQMVDTLFDANKGWADFDPWKIDEPIDEWKQKAFTELAGNPLQAFMVGQMLASEALNATIVRPLLPTDRKAIEFLDHYTFNELNSAFEDLKTNLRQKLIEGVQQGLNPDEVARQLGSELKDYDTDLALIAITETARGESQGRLHELLDAGFEYAIGSSAHDSRVCEQCLELVNGVTVRIEDTLGVTNYGRKRDAWVSCIPLHPRCRCVWLPWTRESDKLINAIQ